MQPADRTGVSRSASILMMVLGIITVGLVIAFAFLRSMQMARGTSLVQRKDDLARIAAEMGMQHASAVCLAEYTASAEIRDNTSFSPLSRYDSPSTVLFAPLSRRDPKNFSLHYPQSYDLSPDEPFNNLYSDYYSMGGRTQGYSQGIMNTPGYARLYEANRFQFRNDGPVYDASTYDSYDAPTAATADATGAADPGAIGGAVKSKFPPTAPFVRGAAITRRHASDNPLLLDADCRAVTNAQDARYRLRYAVNVVDMSAAIWLNTDMAWLTDAQKGAARTSYKDSFYAIGMQLSVGYDRSDPFENLFLGHGSYSNCLFNNGQPTEWPERGGKPMWFRNPSGLTANWYSSQVDGRALHCVHGSPFMKWNDGGNWIGSPIMSYNDLGFAMQGATLPWHNSGEVHDNEGRVRGDMVAQFCATPFGRPYDAATDHPLAYNALLIPSRLLEAIVGAYIPPVLRGVAVTNETVTAYTKTTDAYGTVTYAYSRPFTWAIPSQANITVAGSGVDLFTDSFQVGGQKPFDYPCTPMRDYWTTPVGDPSFPATWRSTHTNPPDNRANAQRYPGAKFFSDPVMEKNGQSAMLWRWRRSNGVASVDGVATDPRQLSSDFAQAVSCYSVWVDGTIYKVDDFVVNTLGGSYYRCTVAHTAAAALDKPGSGTSWGSKWALVTPAPPFTPTDGVDHLGQHIVFYKPQLGGTAAVAKNNAKFLSYYFGVVNNTQEFLAGSPWAVGISGAGGDGKMSVYKGSSASVYTPPVGSEQVVPAAESYPNPSSWLTNAQVAFALTSPPSRAGVGTPLGWKVTRAAGTWGQAGTGVYPNSYYNRLSLAFWHAVCVAQAANLAWANQQDIRSQTFYQCNQNGIAGICYTSAPDKLDYPGPNAATYQRKGLYTKRFTNVPATSTYADPKSADQWEPKAGDYMTEEQIDRQFVANLGESFDRPGMVTPTQALPSSLGGLPTPPSGVVPPPPRYMVNRGGSSDGSQGNFQNFYSMLVAQYLVTNNIRTLLTPIDTNASTNESGLAAMLTASSNDKQLGANVPPNKIWLLDEWNVGGEAGYTPGSVVGDYPTQVAYARARLMERVLNDWRMSFLGASKNYVSTFLPKDFDGDGKVFCSGYLGGTLDPLSGALYMSADSNGNGPGITGGLTVFTVTGCLTMTRSHNYKIRVRGELFDNFLAKAVSEQYLESTLLVDPDANISRSASSGGMEDSVIIQQRPIHNYYRGYLNKAYP